MNKANIKNNLKFIIPAIILLFIVVGLAIFLSKRGNSSVNLVGGQLPEESLVLLTDNGFSPQEVTVKAGTAVRWRNNTNVDGSINSDKYPTNKLYPELNLGKFKPGQTLVHVFTKAGTYTYHDQMDNTKTGTVIVE